MSGGEIDYWTPKDFFDGLEYRYGEFTLDVAASQENTKCLQFYDIESNGLSRDWTGNVWCNPPYNKIGPWITKAIEEVKLGGIEHVVMLLPNGISTKWFLMAWENAARMEIVHGRLNFKGPNASDSEKANSPMGSIVFVFSAGRRLSQPEVRMIDRQGKIMTGRQTTLDGWVS